MLYLDLIGACYDEKTKTIYPMMKDGTPDLNELTGVHIDDMDMPERFQLEQAIQYHTHKYL
jgi:hypothetical protein